MAKANKISVTSVAIDKTPSLTKGWGFFIENPSAMSQSLAHTPLDPAACTRLLQTYHWPQLWEAVRHLHPESGAQRSPLLAIKAMLLAGWWQEAALARECMAAYPARIIDPLTHFALSYTALCLDDVPRYLALRQHAPRNQAPWMRQWLELEVQGRAARSTAQMALVKRFMPPTRTPPAWLCVALLQSNESSRMDIGPLRDWLLSLPEDVKEQELLRALVARCGLPEAYLRNGALESIDTMPPPVLYRYALHLLARRQLVEAVQTLDALARLGFVNLYMVQVWLSLACSIPQGWAGMGERVQHAVNLVPRSLVIQGTVAAYALIAAWIRGDLERAQALVKRFFDYLHLPKSPLIRSTQIFFLYAGMLCNFRRQNPQLYFSSTTDKPVVTLIALGESHSLCLANVVTQWQGQDCKALSAFVMGAKMHHLGHPESSYLGECVSLHLEALKPKPVHLLMTIGEIDCRPDEGLWPLHRKTGQPLDALIERTVSGYIDFLQRTLVGHQLASITIQGIPAPGYAFEEDKDPGDIPGFVAMIRAVNDCLRAKALAARFNFLDVHAATVGADGRGNGRWHLDGYHLSPAFYRQAQDWLLPAPSSTGTLEVHGQIGL